MYFFLTQPPDELPSITEKNLLCFEQTINFWRYKLMRKIEATGMRMLELKQKGLTTMELWNNSQAYLGREVALIYGDISILTIMQRSFQKCQKNSSRKIF